MPYIVNLLPIDAAGFIGLGPSLGGTFTAVAPAPAVATATATAAASTTLSFPTATPPPPGVATVHVTNSSPTGDLFRSGLLTSIPPSPGTLTALSFPTSLTSLSAAALASRVAAMGRIAITPPGWVVALVSAASAGTYIPLGGAVTGIVPTLNTPPGTVTFTVTGFFTFRTYYFFTDTVGFTGTLTTTPAPSGDPTQPGRILSLSGTTTTLATTTTGPSPTLAVLGWFLSLVAPAVGGIVQPQLESAVNQAIDSLVAPGLASLGFIRSPTSVVSARRVVVTGSGLGISLVLADLLGPAFSPVPGTLRVQVTPHPPRDPADVVHRHRHQHRHRRRGAPGQRHPPQLQLHRRRPDHRPAADRRRWSGDVQRRPARDQASPEPASSRQATTSGVVTWAGQGLGRGRVGGSTRCADSCVAARVGP
jgi:hypothetical protein